MKEAVIPVNWKRAIGLPGLVFLSCALLTLTPVYKAHLQPLSNAVLLDLLLTAPILYWFAIRKTGIAKATVLRVFLLGLLLATVLVNTRTNSYLHFIKTWISPVLESAFLFFVFRNVYLAGKRTAAKDAKPDFLLHCRGLLHRLTGNEKAGNVLASEIAVLFYAVAGRKDKGVDYKTSFSSYKESGILAVFYAILFILLIETAGLHFLIALASRPAAWIVTGLSLYSCLQLFAHTRAVKARPVFIGQDGLHVRNGLAGDAVLPFAVMEKIELSRKMPLTKRPVKLTLLKNLEGHNVVVYLKEPVEVTRVFGLKRTADSLAFFVDKPKEFIQSLNSCLTAPAVGK